MRARDTLNGGNRTEAVKTRCTDVAGGVAGSSRKAEFVQEGAMSS